MKYNWFGHYWTSLPKFHWMETVLQKTQPWKSQEDASAQVNSIKNIQFKGILGSPEGKKKFCLQGLPTNSNVYFIVLV